jgi:hypothetical protein
MKRRTCLILTALIFAALSGDAVYAQSSRKSVSGAEVTGTFDHAFTGKFKGSASEIRILALGKGKLKMAFDLIYPFVDGVGELEANSGQVDGVATIEADTAMFVSGDNGECRIKIKFVKPGFIKVDQLGDSSGCGFGLNVSADGTYKKVSSAKPKFD